jgi:hypothetical protein
MKRLNCTVFDKRGVNGDCMEFHAKGKYLRYSEANSRIEELVSKCDKQYNRIAELEKEREWIYVIKELPKTTMSVLVTNGAKVGELTYVKYVNGTGKWAGNNEDIIAWMLKPKSPEALKDQE